MRVVLICALFFVSLGTHAQETQRERDARALQIANTCCSLIGKGIACGSETKPLQTACAKKIDQLTASSAPGRAEANKQCATSMTMSAQFQKAGGNESCSSISRAIQNAVP